MKLLEIGIISAEGLKVKRKRMTFAVVRIGQESRISNHDESGGSYPTWNSKLEMSMNATTQFITIEVYQTVLSGRDKKLGEAKIPVTDFTGRYSPPEGHLNFLSYRLRDQYGDKRGIVNISVVVKPNSATLKSAFPSSSTSKHSDYGVCSSKAVENGLWGVRKEEAPSIDEYGDKIVTGVPVWGVMQRPK